MENIIIIGSGVFAIMFLICIGILTQKVLPYIKEATKNEQLKTIQSWAEIFVRNAAEKKGNMPGSEKHNWVVAELLRQARIRGITITDEDATAVVTAVYNTVKANL